MSNAEAYELARRAVACKGWRLIRGVVARDKHGTEFVFVGLHADGQQMWAAAAGWLVESSVEIDFDAPSTIGCLLQLVREAWGCPEACTSRLSGWHVHPYATNGLVGDTAPISGPWSAGHQTEAGALVAALEAAP